MSDLRIFNKTISDSKKICIKYSLSILYGINVYQSKKICKNIGINPKITLKKLNNDQVKRLMDFINKNLKIEYVLKKYRKDQVNYLLNIKNIRGVRMSQGLPVNGQRTHSNAKTVRKLKLIKLGKKKTSKKKYVYKKKKRKNEKK